MPKCSLRELIPNASPLAIDLLEKILVYNPEKRLTAEAALAHPFFDSIRNLECERNSVAKVQISIERSDKQMSSSSVTISRLKQMLVDEMKFFHPTFKEKDKSSYKTPLLRDEELLTLDTDGQFVYIGKFVFSQTDY